MSNEITPIPDIDFERRQALDAMLEAREREAETPLAAMIRLDRAFLETLCELGSYEETREIFVEAGREYRNVQDELNYLGVE